MPSNANLVTITGVTATTNTLNVGNVNASVLSGNIIVGNTFAYSNGQPILSSYGNANVAGFLPLYGGQANFSNVVGTILTSTQNNITSLGPLNQLEVNGDTLLHGDMNLVANLSIQHGGITLDDTVNGNIYTLANIVAQEQIYAGANVVAEEWLVGNYLLVHNNAYTANIYTDGYYFANGQPFIGANISNAQIQAALLGALPSYTGNIGANTITATGNITGSFFFGNVSTATGFPTLDNYSNANVGAYLSTGISSNIITTGNVSGTYFLGNVSQATGFPTLDNYSNANVGAYLDAGISSNIITTGNVSGTYFLGNVSQATGFPTLDNYSNANVGAYLAAGISSNIITTGNISATYLIGNGSLLTGVVANYGNANVADYLPTDPTIIAIEGNIANLTANTYGNSNVATYLPTYTGNLASLTGNVTTSANISGNVFIGTSGNVFISPVRQDDTSNTTPMYYNPTTSEVTYATNVASQYGNFTITNSGDTLVFAYNGANIAIMSSTGAITSADNITAFAPV